MEPLALVLGLAAGGVALAFAVDRYFFAPLPPRAPSAAPVTVTPEQGPVAGESPEPSQPGPPGHPPPQVAASASGEAAPREAATREILAGGTTADEPARAQAEGASPESDGTPAGAAETGTAQAPARPEPPSP